MADALARLDRRLSVLLPPLYRETYQDMTPTPMRSAGFVFDGEGRVAWDRMWGSFCDLAMAGGPPHKGRWLAPAAAADIAADPHRYDEVVDEIRRGIGMVTGLDVRQADDPGWIPVACYGEAMAEWLTRAIVMENVAARRRRVHVDLPASPAFRLEKEIRNVITVIAKTAHYWVDHLPYSQQAQIGALFAELAAEGPAIPPGQPGAAADDGARVLAAALTQATGRAAAPSATAGWVSLPCDTVAGAVWMMRALVASNVLARREETTLLVPVNVPVDPGGSIAAQRVADVLALARYAGRA
jgi:sirohydrochlorin cobaltochelatase